MGLSARRANLWARQVIARKVLKAAAPLIILAARLWRALLFRTTFIGITGSLGKTTTKETLAAIFAAQAPTYRTRGNQNGGLMPAINLLRVRPWHRFAVFEFGISKPNQMGHIADLVRPHLAIVLGLARVHTKGFKDRAEYAAEKAALLPHVAGGGTVLLNADDAAQRGFEAPAGVRVLRFGLTEGADYRAEAITASWPDRLAFRIERKGQSWPVQTQLLGSHWAPSILAAVAAAEQCGIPVEKAAAAVRDARPYVARLEPVTLPNGATIIRDDYSCSVDGFQAGLRFLREARALRRMLVFSDVSDSEVNRRSRLRQLGTAVAGWLDLLVLSGHDSAYGRRKVIESGMAPEAAFAFETLRETSEFLRRELRPEDLVLLAGRTSDHVTRVFFAQAGSVQCWREPCPKKCLCDGCWELGFAPDGSFVPPTAGRIV